MKTSALRGSVTALLAAPLSTFAQLYSVEVIGPIDSSYTFAAALNNAGTVLGGFGGQEKKRYLSSGGVATFPGNLGALSPNGNGLNDAGDFVGQYYHNGNYHAYVSIGGVVTDLARSVARISARRAALTTQARSRGRLRPIRRRPVLFSIRAGS